MNFGWRFNWNIGCMIGEVYPLNQQLYEDLISHFGTRYSLVMTCQHCNSSTHKNFHLKPIVFLNSILKGGHHLSQYHWTGSILSSHRNVKFHLCSWYLSLDSLTHSVPEVYLCKLKPEVLTWGYVLFLVIIICVRLVKLWESDFVDFLLVFLWKGMEKMWVCPLTPKNS